jgi:hypothetical protein
MKTQMTYVKLSEGLHFKEPNIIRPKLLSKRGEPKVWGEVTQVTG